MLEEKSLKELRVMGKERKIPKWARLKKKDLIQALEKPEKIVPPRETKQQVEPKGMESDPWVGKTLKELQRLGTQLGIPKVYALKKPALVETIKTEIKALREEPILELPKTYQQNTLALMVQNTEWMYAYWDLEQGAFKHYQWVLRLYNRTENTAVDHPIDPEHREIYLHGTAGRVYSAEIGYLQEGEWVAIAQSNEVTLPSGGVSRVVASLFTTVADTQKPPTLGFVSVPAYSFREPLPKPKVFPKYVSLEPSPTISYPPQKKRKALPPVQPMQPVRYEQRWNPRQWSYIAPVFLKGVDPMLSGTEGIPSLFGAFSGIFSGVFSGVSSCFL